MQNTNTTTFAPQPYIKNGIRNVKFYTDAFDAVEVLRRTNDDGTLHVAELSIHGVIFHLHEQSVESGLFSPETCQGTTVTIGLFVPDVDAVMSKALAAGATQVSPAQNYDYGYRQGRIRDPFGHIWLIESEL